MASEKVLDVKSHTGDLCERSCEMKIVSACSTRRFMFYTYLPYMLKLLALIVAFVFTHSTTLAASVTIGDNTWTYSISGGKVTITGVSPASGDISMPGKVNGYTVTGVGKAAFRFCSDLTSVTIPDSVVSIGDEAFHWCDGLTSVTIGNSVFPTAPS